MKISTKLTLALGTAAVVAFGTYGFHLVHSESAELHTAAEQELRLLGRSVQLTLEQALRDGQTADVQQTLAKLELAQPELDLFLFDIGGSLVSSTGHPPPDLHALAPDVTQSLSRDTGTGPERLLLTLPLRGDDGVSLGTLVAARPLAGVEQDIERTKRGVALWVAGFIVLTAGIVLALGRTLIGQPLHRLARALQRVRAGDLPSDLAVSRRDEVSAVALEVNALVRELRETREKLESETQATRRLERGLEHTNKLVTIGQLSAGLAHEIGSPLQIMSGRARALLVKAHDTAETKRNAEILVAQTERITRIVAQLLRFAHRGKARWAKIDLEPTVVAVLDLLDYELRRAGLELDFEAAGEACEVYADADQLQQIVLNLVANAIAATPRGGRIEVRLAAGSKPAAPGRAELRPSMRLMVRDTGIGMSPSTHERLFEPFFTTKEAGRGLGLGLSVVRAIVVDHGGTVAVESKLGEGSTFTVELPTRSNSTHARGEANDARTEKVAHPRGG